VERLARAVVERPRLTILLVLIVTGLLAAQLRHLRLEVKVSDEVPENHPYTRIDRRIQALFHAEQTSLLALRVRHGDIFNAATLARIQRMTEAVERLPGVVPSSVLSIAAERAKVLLPGPDGLQIVPLLQRIPQDEAGLRELRERTFSYPMYVGNLVTPDATGATILADFGEKVSVKEATAALEEIAARERDANTEIYVGGQGPALAALQQATERMLPLFVVAILVIAVVHYEAFRTVQAVILPLATAALSVVWSMGLLGVLGFQVTPWTALTAILVLAVAAGHAVQILKRYYEVFAEVGENRAAVIVSLVRIGPVMATAGLIAAAGFASLATFGVPAVRDFGLMAALGIVSAVVIELTFIPACRALLGRPQRSERARERAHSLLDPAIDAIGAFVTRRPRLAVFLVLAGVTAAGVGMLRLQINTSFRGWFRPDAPVIVADNAIRRHITGTSTIRVLVEGGEADAILDPAVLRTIGELQQLLASQGAITGTLSVAADLRTKNRAMHDGDPAFYSLPESRELAAQYLLLFDSTDLARVVTPDYRAAVIYALARSDKVAWVEDLFGRLRQLAARTAPPTVRVEVGGGELAQSAATTSSVVREKILNMIQVGCVIFLLTALVFRSAAAAVLVLAPLACAAIVNVGLMGWIGSWLSFTTASYTAMGVSLGADFAIYLIFRLREEIRRGDLVSALRETLRTSGRAIFFVASAVAAGNATLLLSDFQPWRQLGGYVALMMATSALATVSLLPALILLTRPRFLLRVEGEAAPDVAPLPERRVG
jgi:hydrophobe/amphiphile efflux-3 (HAE3) family protein